jgi:hypothetical protein
MLDCFSTWLGVSAAGTVNHTDGNYRLGRREITGGTPLSEATPG